MKTIALLTFTSLLSACNFVTLPGNDPDSGVSCLSSMAPAGSGTTSSFAVGSSYEVAAQTFNPDSGVVTGAQLNFSLLRKSISCVDRADAGAGDGFFATIYSYGADRVVPGTYLTSLDADGGPSFVGFNVEDGGLKVVTGGPVTLATVPNCTVSGSLDGKFSTADGGFSPLTGTFSSEYCAK